MRKDRDYPNFRHPSKDSSVINNISNHIQTKIISRKTKIGPRSNIQIIDIEIRKCERITAISRTTHIHSKRIGICNIYIYISRNIVKYLVTTNQALRTCTSKVKGRTGNSSIKTSIIIRISSVV